eukprot:TRINITY_DN11043_c0_g1_i2.p1 TRINITY_DN11043_c0_g1~~TRINITY_DN11043_c0_g1_i2.p1  ORF type:complete len:169 (+),score=49.47 TRINITY_DN11043_c0_g1_i2:1-507(+)
MMSRIRISVCRVVGKVPYVPPDAPLMFSISVPGSARVADLKSAIQTASGVTPKDQTLSLGVTFLLNDDASCEDLGIVEGTMLELAQTRNTGMYNIFIRVHGVSDAAPLPLQVSYGHSVHQVKLLVEKMMGIPEGEQRLVFAGKQLDDFRVFCHYGIQVESTIYIVRRI